jgi:hypothetical protein
VSIVKVNAITDASGGNTATINSMTPTADSLQGFRNRIINGDMRIDQRNAGASVTPTSGQYLVDRWLAGVTQASKFSVQQNAGSVTPPAGFTNYLGVTSLSAYSIVSSDIFFIAQRIEGLNCADLAWGTANAKTVTLSFWVRSSLTGTFGGSLANSGSTRSYPFTYTISAANTWEQKSVTIAGDTSGTWLTTNGIGINVHFSLGSGSTYSGTAGAWAAANYTSATGATSVVGTNAATFYITGVQLEVGSVATPFERRPYGTELSLCQRYYYKQFGGTSSIYIGGVGLVVSTTALQTVVPFPTQMRIAPTALEQTGSASDYRIVTGAGVTTNCSAVPTFVNAQVWQAATTFTVSSGLTAGGAGFGRELTTSAFLAWSAEL